jgi:hypothetical protein
MHQTVYDHYLFYQRFLLNWWENLGPAGYTGLLLTVGIIGWITMRGPKGS